MKAGGNRQVPPSGIFAWKEPRKRFRGSAKRNPTCGQKFTEPGALSSSTPTNLRLPPTAYRSGIALLASRARCKAQSRAVYSDRQGSRLSNFSQKARNSTRLPFVRQFRSTKNSPSRVRFRPDPRLTFGFRLLAARGTFDLVASRARCKRHTRAGSTGRQGGFGQV